MKKKINKKSEEYKQGFIDGYEKAFKDYQKIRKEIDVNMKPLRDAIQRLRRRNL